MSWEDDDYAPELQTTSVVEVEDQALLQITKAEEEAKAAAAAAKAAAEARAAAEAEKKRQYEQYLADNTPLSDPVAERERLKRLQEKQDIALLQESMGGVSLVENIALNSNKDFIAYCEHVSSAVLTAARKSDAHKDFAVNFFRLLLSKNLETFSTDQLKVIEEAAKTARLDKMKLERAVRQAATKANNAKKNQKVQIGDEFDDYGFEDESYNFSGNAGDVAASTELGGFENAPEDEFVRQTYEAEEEFM